VLVNTAGDVWGARLTAFPTADWDALVGAHLRGSFLCAKHAAPHLAEGGDGRIVNVASVLAGFGVPGLAHYCSAKAGVLGLTRALAVELAPVGIRVNALVPGFFETELSVRNTSPERRAETRRHTPAGRWGDPEEIVGAAVLLATRASGYMTGSTVVVDGGYSVSDRELND
jgi:NAD(P)-dependent dehydrogenase (short-subunit alcohol dehydrogenase family)